MKGVILVAGKGSRMYPLGKSKPKALLRVLNKPIIHWSIESLYENGINDIVIVTSPDEFGDMINEYVQSIDLPNLKVTNVPQENPMGTGHAVQVTNSEFSNENEEFILMNGDDLYGPNNIKSLIEHEGLAIIGLKVENPERYGIFKTDNEGNLLELIEKPRENIGNLASIGLAKLNARIFETFERTEKSERGEFEVTDGITLLAQEQGMKVIPNSDYWIPLGYPWQLLEANNKLADTVEEKIEGKIEENVTINGTVILPASSTIKAGTYIDGTLIVGENTEIGPNAYIRGVVTVGDNSQIGFSVEAKDAILGDNCKSSHLSYIGYSVLGDNIRFGSHSTTASRRHDRSNISTPVKGKMTDTGHAKLGAFIGDDAKIGVGTLIYPGRKIWPGMITKPGQIVDKDIVSEE